LASWQLAVYQMSFSCAPRNSDKISSEEVNMLELPHLEDIANDQYGYIQFGDLDDPDTFAQWLKCSEDPEAVAIRAMDGHPLYEEINTIARDTDKDYWSSHVPTHYHEFGVVFSQKASECMPTRKPYDHAIEIIPGNNLPKPAKLYPMLPHQKSLLDEWIIDELAKGYIRTSKSPTAALVFFVEKPNAPYKPDKNGIMHPQLHLVQDYRKLNSVTKKNKFPIPCISDLIDNLSQASIFTSLDLRWGFNNVRIREGDKEKAVFITHKGLFEPTVMYFGFCNAPSTFQAMMNDVLKEEIATGKVQVYIDDILIFTNNLDEHRTLMR
jgi:hypothetical protein